MSEELKQPASTPKAKIVRCGKDCTHSGGWGDGYGHGLGVASILGARDNHRVIVGIQQGEMSGRVDEHPPRRPRGRRRHSASAA